MTSGSGLLGKARGDRAGKYNQDSCYYSLKNSGDGFQSGDEVEPSLTEATQERHAQIFSPGRTLRERQASLADLPTKAERCKVYMGSDTRGFRIAECTWSPRDGCIGAGWLLQWLTPREIQTATLPVILTFFDNHGHWLAWTIAMESESLPGQYGLIAARDFGEGDTLGFMREGHIADFERGSAALHAAVAERVSSGGGRFLYTLPAASKGMVALCDGQLSRPGGPRAANDARGLARVRQNCAFMEDGRLNVISRSIPARRP